MALASPSAAGIGVACTIRQGRIAAVTVSPRRPYPVEKLLAGRTPAEAFGLFANLFALCPEAHCNAAAAAMAAALALQLPPGLREWQDCRRRLEIVKEHSFYLLRQQPPADPATAQTLLATCRRLAQAMGGTALYWPAATPPAMDTAAMAEGLATLDRGLAQLCGGFWNLPDDGLESVYRWQASLDSSAAQLLQRYAQIGWADFGHCASPCLPNLATPDGLDSAQPLPAEPLQETGSYARLADAPLIQAACSRHGNGLYTRALARLLELKTLFHGLATLPHAVPDALPAPGQDSGSGWAQTEASRGRLRHRAALSGGRIADYQILAPTEWNFHPQGLLQQALLGAPADENLTARLEALLHAIDPCVDFHLRVEQA